MAMLKNPDTITAGLAQISPVWLDKQATLDKIVQYIKQAGREGLDLIAFGEALLPGYPFWVELTDGARFNSAMQKANFAYYVRHAIDIDGGDLDTVCQTAEMASTAVYLGIIERPRQRSGMSLYCSMVYIDAAGRIQSVHRKLMPTFEERLVWSPGDGHGLVTHALGNFRLGGLNCWENWMPLPRAALYGQGENFHVSIWPGSVRNTEDITPFLAKEGRLFSMAVSGLMPVAEISPSLPFCEEIVAATQGQEFLANGGSCLAGPDGDWIIEPQVGNEGLFSAEIHLDRVREERQNFDPAGHYSRPDVTRLVVNQSRQSTVDFIAD